MRDFSLIEETLAYVTAEDQVNTDPRYLVRGSQNVLIDRNRKVTSRKGYSRLGAANSAITPIKKGLTWNSSTGTEYPMRAYDVTLEVYLDSIDGTTVDAWTNVKVTLTTANTPRFDTWWDATENIDLLLFVQSDANIYEWSGGAAVVSSITGTTITKTGTTTFAQNRFYTSRNKTLVCTRTGTEYTYTGGEGTTTLTGISDTAGLVAGDVLLQKVVTNSNKPAASHQNDTILDFENQICIGSFIDNEVWISKNTSFTDYSYSAPRIAGEGALLTLDGPCGGLGSVSGILVAFAGRDGIFKAEYQEIAVGTTLAETLKVKKLKTGIGQSSQSPDCVIPIGNSLVYLSYEPALRELTQAQLNDQTDVKTLSNPIKPDFDAEDWTGAQGMWSKSSLYIAAQATSHLYILEFVEDADGKVRRFWQPPQILPVGSMVIISSALHGHSNAVPETYKLFDTYSDINSSDEKLPINAIAAFAYNSYKKRALLKNFDEYFVEGEITPSTNDLSCVLNYNYAGYLQIIERTIDGTDEDILQESVGSVSLGQNSLGTQPLGGLLSAPSDARKFQVILEIAREDFSMIQAVFSTNEIDRYWAVTSHGPNVARSSRKNIGIKK